MAFTVIYYHTLDWIESQNVSCTNLDLVNYMYLFTFKFFGNTLLLLFFHVVVICKRCKIYEMKHIGSK